MTAACAKVKIEASSSSDAPGEHPGDGRDDTAWRWRAALRQVLRGGGESQGVLAERLAGNDADAESDADTAQLERYLRYRCGERPQSEIGEEEYLAIHRALRIWSDRGREYYTLPFELEAGVLAELEPGSLLPLNDSTDALTQYYYERIFYDIRGRLKDREWLLRNVFASPWQTTRAAVWGFRRKVTAHALGADDYAAWIAGTAKPPKVRRIALRFAQVLDYLNGLHVLGLAHPDDAVRLFRWLFADVESAASDAAWERMYFSAVMATPDWRERLAGLAERIPAS